MHNLIAHGLVDEIDPATNALALRASALLILRTAEQHKTVTPPPSEQHWQSPDGGPRGSSWRQRLAAAIWAARRELQG